MMTVAEQQVALKRYGFTDDDPIMDWLNAAMHNIESYEDWPWLEQLSTITNVLSSNALVLPANTFKVISLRDVTNNHKLQRWERTKFDRLIWDPTVTGNADIYVETGMTTIQVYPVPDAVDTFEVVTQIGLTDVVAGALTPPPIPEIFHYPMVINAAYIALMAENEEDRATAALRQFQDAMDKGMKKFGGRTLDEPERVEDAMGYGYSV